MAVLDLRCCVCAFFSWSEWGLPSQLWCVDLSLVASLVGEPGLWIAQASVAVAHGLSCPVACGSFLDPRD